MNLSIDFGYGWVKALLGSKLTQFPHAIGTPDPVRYRTQTTTAYPITVRRDESHSYYVGDDAIRQSRHAWSHVTRERNAWELRAFLAFAVAHLSTNVETVIDTCVSGLPVAWYSEDQGTHVDAIQSSLQFQYKTDVWRTISVKSVVVLPQPMGTYHYFAQSHPEVTDPDFYLGIIDVGHFTTDCAVIAGGEYLAPQSFSTPIGIKKLQDDLVFNTQQVYQRELTPQQADRSLRQGYVKVRGEQKDLLIDSALAALTSEVIAAINNQWQGARALDGVVVSGGGARFLFDAIKELYPHAETLDEPELANVRGYQIAGE